VDERLAASYTVVAFDPRGVGLSAPVACLSPAATDTYLYGIEPGTIGSATWIASEKAKSRALESSCEKHTGPVLDHIDSVNAAADMDLIRAALGEKKLNYLGYSYGTYLGTLYAGLFPHSVGRMVLDGAEDPWGDNFVPEDGPPSASGDEFGTSPDVDSSVAQAQGFEQNLNAFIRSCLKNDWEAVGTLHCPFTSTFAKARKQIEQVFAKVNVHPLLGDDGRRLGGATLATAIDQTLYDKSDWPKLAKIFVQLKTGNPTEAFVEADAYNGRNSSGRYDDNQEFAGLAIDCLEGGSTVELSFDRREAKELRKVAPILGIYSGYGDLVCSGWADGPSPFPNPIHAKGTGPILVLGTTDDPATPYQDAKSLAQQLDGGHLVTLHGTGHLAYDLGNSCIDTTVDAYFLNGTVPARDPDCI